MLTRGRNTREVRERMNCMRHLVWAGVPRKHVARILGYASRSSLNVSMINAGIKGRSVCPPQNIPLGPRPCVSCLKKLPKGHGFPRCVACDRAHHRHGDCACGYAIRMSAATCKRCGVARAEALKTRSKARRAAVVAAVLAEPLRPLGEFVKLFGYKGTSSVYEALSQEGACERRRRLIRLAKLKACQSDRQRRRQNNPPALTPPEA